VHVVCQAEEVYHSTIGPDPERLIATLKRFEPSVVHTARPPKASGRRRVYAAERGAFPKNELAVVGSDHGVLNVGSWHGTTTNRRWLAAFVIRMQLM
jgi:hypothetical protein